MKKPITTADIHLPAKLAALFAPPRGSLTYRAAYGGRGSGKSMSFAKMAALWGFCERLRILCVREFQASIKESFYAELKTAIESMPFLAAHYQFSADGLRGKNGTEFLFRGLFHAPHAVKSLAEIDLTIIEEAEDISETGWLMLEATVLRRPKAEIWAIWNPRNDGSPVDERFIKQPPPRAAIVEVNWRDNPFFPDGLERLRQREQNRLDAGTYQHIWEGGYLSCSQAQVFSKHVRVAPFTPQPHWHGPYQGGDFGFSQDPTAAIRCYIADDVLYVSHEAYKTTLELDDTAAFIETRIPGFSRYVTRWDNARPESISFLKRHGLPLSTAAQKWPGSVEDGVAFLRALRAIELHPRCENLAREMRLYSYKVDPLSGDVRPQLNDAFNHGIDALRYALCPLIRRKGYSPQEMMTVFS